MKQCDHDDARKKVLEHINSKEYCKVQLFLLKGMFGKVSNFVGWFFKQTK